jgi:hypothetical protein
MTQRRTPALSCEECGSAARRDQTHRQLQRLVRPARSGVELQRTVFADCFEIARSNLGRSLPTKHKPRAAASRRRSRPLHLNSLPAAPL